MLFRSKKEKKPSGFGLERRQSAADKERLYPVLHAAGSVKERQKEIVEKEVDALQQLSRVNESFNGVLTNLKSSIRNWKILNRHSLISARYPISLKRLRKRLAIQ